MQTELVEQSNQIIEEEMTDKTAVVDRGLNSDL